MKGLIVAQPVQVTAELLAEGSTTTVSNTSGAWWLIHAPTDGAYREALNKVPRGIGGLQSESLCSVQLRMSGMGYVCVEPTWCIRGSGYWYLRNTSNLGSSHPAGYAQYPTLVACMNAALAWCEEAPARREAIVSQYALDCARKEGTFGE